jgi:hypothetical protein
MPPRPASPLAAKDRARRANKAARGCDPRAAAYDRWLAIALEIMIDMKGWQAGKVRGVTE